MFYNSAEIYLRRLRVFGVYQMIVFLFCQAVLESLVGFGMSVCFGNLTGQLKTKINSRIHTAMKVMGKKECQSLQLLYNQSVTRQAQRSLTDPIRYCVMNTHFCCLVGDTEFHSLN